MKLLVVDDFEADRNEIVEMVKTFQDIAIDHIEECDDGMSAIDLVEADPPDIILCDIEMPYMDGFTIRKIIQNDYPDIKFVFCSLYNQTQYLKNALDLRCNGYILKPVSREELYDCLKQLTDERITLLQEKKELSNLRDELEKSKGAQMQLFLMDLLHGYMSRSQIEEKQKELRLEEWFPGMNIAVLEFDDFLESTEKQDRSEKQYLFLMIWRTVHDVLNECQEKPPAFFVHIESERLCYGFHGRQVSSKEFLAYNQKIIQKCRLINASVTIAVSLDILQISEMANAYEQCIYMLRFKYSAGKGRILQLNDIPGTHEININFSVVNLQKDLFYAINSGDHAEIDRFLNEYFRIPQDSMTDTQKNVSIAVIVFAQMLLNESGESLSSVFGFENQIWEKLLKFETIQDAYMWMKNILSFISDFLTKKNEMKKRGTICQVKKYIMENVSADLHLNQIARNFFYSPNYLNTQFKKETNLTISEYITSVKIDAARKLLQETNKPIAEISAEVGFEHVSYFNYVFKRFEGIAPREFRMKRAT